MRNIFIKNQEKRQPIGVTKKGILSACFIALACACFAQDVIVTKDSKRINAKVTEVNVDNIKYKQFENQNGPVYTLLKSDILTILYQNGQVESFGVESSSSSTAATATTSATVNTQKKVAAPYSGPIPSKEELKQKMAINAPHFYDRYKSASTLSGVGAGMTIGGVALAIIGGITANKEELPPTNEYETRYKLSGPGAAVMGVGIVSALAGTPIWIVGGSKKKKTRNAYLQEFGYSYHIPVQPSPYLKLKTTSNGLGLALVF